MTLFVWCTRSQSVRDLREAVQKIYNQIMKMTSVDRR